MERLDRSLYVRLWRKDFPDQARGVRPFSPASARTFHPSSVPSRQSASVRFSSACWLSDRIRESSASAAVRGWASPMLASSMAAIAAAIQSAWLMPTREANPTASAPNTAKQTLGSAVSNATKSFAVEDLDGNGQKQFYAHEIKDKDGNVTGTELRV